MLENVSSSAEIVIVAIYRNTSQAHKRIDYNNDINYLQMLGGRNPRGFAIVDTVENVNNLVIKNKKGENKGL